MSTPQTPPTPSASLVVEATRANFEREVIDRSRDAIVLVDFWAAWCGPCKILGPILERIVREFDGKVVLVKADTDALPEIAQAFGVSSIPAVYALRDGRVVDMFVGALPEESLREWIQGLLPSPVEELLGEAKSLEPSDPKAAEQRYRAALGLEANNPLARTGLVRSLLHQGQVDAARQELAPLQARGYLEPEAEAILAELELAAHAREAGGVEAARAALAASPNDPTARLHLAETLAASGGHEEALELALALVEEHLPDVSDQARQAMVRIFQLLPPDSELANDYRRRLSAALY